MKKITFPVLFAVFLSSCGGSAERNNLADTTIVDTTVNIDTDTTLNAEIKELSSIEIDSVSFKKLFKAANHSGDEFKDRKYLRDQTSPRYVDENGIYCYLSYTDSDCTLRFKIQYTADDWLFIKSMTFNTDGENFDYQPSEFSTDSGGGVIWEWSDQFVAVDELKMLVAIANAKTAKVKFYGTEYYKIVPISKKQQNAILNMLKLYKGFKLGFNK